MFYVFFFFFLSWMWENIGKASRDWTNQREQSEKDLVLEELLCFWQRWQYDQRCVVVFTVYKEGAADGKLLEMLMMCRGPGEEGYPWNNTCCALWMHEAALVSFQWPLKAACNAINLGPSSPFICWSLEPPGHMFSSLLRPLLWGMDFPHIWGDLSPGNT